MVNDVLHSHVRQYPEHMASLQIIAIVHDGHRKGRITRRFDRVAMVNAR
jgi:hypothetical protein